jgi:hypothetical protein
VSEITRRCAGVLAVCCALAVGSCAPKRTAPAAPVIVAPSEFAQDVRMVTSLLFEFGARELLARAVVEKAGDQLDLWLLTPNGVRLCHFHQEGDQLTRDDRTEACELLDPRYVLQDLRWSYFQGCVDGSPCQVGDASFVESVDPATGDVVERTVDWQGVQAVITFEEYRDGDGGRHPRRAVIDNRTYGYSITILVETYEEAGAPPSR